MELAAIKAVATAALIAGTAAGFAWFVHHERDVGRAQVQAKWDAERAALKAEVADQRARNLDLQREAEKHYTVVTEVRERFITKTVTEVRDATKPLAACPVGSAGVLLLNAASHCASADSSAACRARGSVQPAR